MINHDNLKNHLHFFKIFRQIADKTVHGLWTIIKIVYKILIKLNKMHQSNKKCII
jgi:hypothetical protein